MDAQDINIKDVNASLPAFEEVATIFYIDITKIASAGKPYETLSKKIGTLPHKLTFGLLNKHHVAGWESSPDDDTEYLSFAFMITGRVQNMPL